MTARTYPERRTISERQSHIEDRKQVCHWEGDTVSGAANKQTILTIDGTKSRFAVLAKVLDKSSDLVGRGVEEKLNPYGSCVKTFNVYNGKEFADHQSIDQTLDIQIYFVDPYCSWQDGSNENFKGLMPQYIPKKRRMETVIDEELTMIRNRLNLRLESGWDSRHPTKCFSPR